jgi:hypothetical protein
MRRIHFFIIILIATLSVLLTLTLVSWYFATTSPSYYGSSWMGQMWGSHLGTDSNYGMGGMMGNGSTASASYLWLVPVALGVAVGVAIIGVAFYYAFPEFKYIRGNTTCSPVSINSGTQTQAVATINPITISQNAKVAGSCEVLLKTMTPEEQKVLSVLVAHNGKYLQKYVVKESGLSRLKTHRIVARFAQRGIVTVKEFGNTNEIVVSDWVKY